jgi:DegV family protein with EDD domain
MSKIKIVTDSASDIPLKHQDLYDIEVLPIKITLGDEVYTHRTEQGNTEFYEMLEDADSLPVTEAISAFEFGELYYDLFDQGYTDIIYISVNSEGSDTYYNAVQAKDQFFEDNTDAKSKINIYCIDSKTYSAGYGYAAIQAAKMADKGTPATEIVKFLRDWFENCVVYFGLYGLKYARKSEIIDFDSVFMGELIGFRPIMEIRNKEITTEATVRREAAIVPFLAELCADEIEKGTPYCIIYGNDAQVKDDLSKLLTKYVGYPPADSYQLGAAVASHAGCEAVGVVFKSK